MLENLLEGLLKLLLIIKIIIKMLENVSEGINFLQNLRLKLGRGDLESGQLTNCTESKTYRNLRT